MSHQNSEERALMGEGTTLLTPTVRLDNPFGRRAVEIYRRAMCRDNDRPQRVKLLTEALEVVPEFREAYFWRGILNFVDVQQNIADLRRALNLTMLDSCQYLVIQSQIEAMSRFPEQAVVILTHALRLAKNDGDLGEIYYFRAFANWWIDRDEDAFADCQKAIQKEYNLKSCYTHLADMARYMNKPHEEILQYYQMSLLPSPRYTELVKYAIYLKKKNQKIMALSVLEAAIQKNPHSPDAYEERASITYGESDYLQALQLDSHAKLVQCRRMYAAVLADKKQHKKAIAVLTAGIRARPRAEWYCLRGQLRIEFATSEKEQLKGCADLRKAVQLNPADADLQFWLGIAISRIKAASSMSVPGEALQRSRNALLLGGPLYPRMTEDQRSTLMRLTVPEFKFFDNEVEGLYQFSKHGTAYQYAVTTRKVVCLLADYATDEIIPFKVFRRYSSQLYMWLKSGKAQWQLSTEKSLLNLWNQKIPDHVLYLMKKIPIMSHLSIKHFLNDISDPSYASLQRCLILNDFPSLETLISEFRSGHWGDDVFQVFIHFIYRKPITVSQQVLSGALELASRLENQTFENFLKKHIMSSNNSGGSGNEATASSSDKQTETESNKKPKVRTLKFQKLFKDLSQSINNKSFSDITFSFSDNKSIKGNKLILSANCPYLSRMLNSGLRETTQTKIEITNMTYELWYQIMSYCYGGKVHLTPHNCIELLQIADEFGLANLKLLCELYIGQSIDEDNIDQIHLISNIYNAERLRMHCEYKKRRMEEPVEMKLLEQHSVIERLVEKN